MEAALTCPVSLEVMRDPVICMDGHTYERRVIEEHFRVRQERGLPITSPLTNEEIPNTLVPNRALRLAIEAAVVNKKDKKKSKKKNKKKKRADWKDPQLLVQMKQVFMKDLERKSAYVAAGEQKMRLNMHLDMPLELQLMPAVNPTSMTHFIGGIQLPRGLVLQLASKATVNWAQDLYNTRGQGAEQGDGNKNAFPKSKRSWKIQPEHEEFLNSLAQTFQVAPAVVHVCDQTMYHRRLQGLLRNPKLASSNIHVAYCFFTGGGEWIDLTPRK